MKSEKICMYAEMVLAVFLVLLLLRISIHRTVQTISPNTQPKLAIVIDDFGNNSAGTEEMLALPIPFTGAVMPQMLTKINCWIMVKLLYFISLWRHTQVREVG